MSRGSGQPRSLQGCSPRLWKEKAISGKDAAGWHCCPSFRSLLSAIFPRAVSHAGVQFLMKQLSLSHPLSCKEIPRMLLSATPINSLVHWHVIPLAWCCLICLGWIHFSENLHGKSITMTCFPPWTFSVRMAEVAAAHKQPNHITKCHGLDSQRIKHHTSNQGMSHKQPLGFFFSPVVTHTVKGRLPWRGRL